MILPFLFYTLIQTQSVSPSPARHRHQGTLDLFGVDAFAFHSIPAFGTLRYLGIRYKETTGSAGFPAVVVAVAVAAAAVAAANGGGGGGVFSQVRLKYDLDKNVHVGSQ